MAKKKQFAPHIYPEWGELFDNLPDKQNADILKAIAKFPNYEPENNPIWNFIKSQIEKDYEIFIDKCNKNESIIRNYWQKKKSDENIRTNTNEYERIPKRITNNDITNNDITNKSKRTNTNDIERIPTKKQIEDYANNQLGKYINADDFINWYSEQGWLDKNGFPINWKQKVQSWVKRNKKEDSDDIGEYNAYI